MTSQGINLIEKSCNLRCLGSTARSTEDCLRLLKEAMILRSNLHNCHCFICVIRYPAYQPREAFILSPRFSIISMYCNQDRDCDAAQPPDYGDPLFFYFALKQWKVCKVCKVGSLQSLQSWCFNPTRLQRCLTAALKGLCCCADVDHEWLRPLWSLH